MDGRSDVEITWNPDQWPGLSDANWVALHVPRYKTVRPRYRVFAGFLRRLLDRAARSLRVKGMVDARAKGTQSFAHKIRSKRALYVDSMDPLPPDPLVRMTDLCAGRVIVQTSEQVKTVCRFIERAFDIDWANSRQADRRLKPTELGYRSVHYVITVNPVKLRDMDLGIPVPVELAGFGPEVVGPTAANRPLKAEIQVRTLLEHAWCELQHDMIYKTELKVPDRLLRHFAVVSAVLEEADREFGHLIHAFAAYRANLGAHHSRREVEEEIERQKIVSQCEPKNLNLVLRIARLCHMVGRHQEALSLLDRAGRRDQPEVQRFLGRLLTEMHWDCPLGDPFRRGCDLLERACHGGEPDAETLCALAEARAHREQTESARTLFERAVALDPTQPLVLCRYLEFELEKAGNIHLVRLAAPMIRNAADRAYRQIEARVNLPGAWFSLAVFHLLLREPYRALSALGQVSCLCDAARDPGEAARPCVAEHILQRARGTLERLRPVSHQLEGFTWFERLLLLILAVRTADVQAKAELAQLASSGSPVSEADEQVVILCGGGAPEADPHLQVVRELMLKATKGLSFTLLSGGTQAGISGLAGDVVAESAGRIRAVGCVPTESPYRTIADTERVTKDNTADGVDLTPLDVLQIWIDLLQAGVSPHTVKVLCYMPCDIAYTQCVTALVLGARVGIIEDSRRPEDQQFKAAEWSTHPCFAPLPLDGMTLRAFLQIGTAPLTDSDKYRLEKAARMAHQDYVKSVTPEELSLQNWDKLDSALRLSNYHQVAYWEDALREHRLGVRPLTEEDKRHDPLDLDEVLGATTIETLAEMEHGRWNVERLYYGWRRARQKDVARRLSPYLIPWDKVPPVIQKLDFDAIRCLPKKLREAGMELYRL